MTDFDTIIRGGCIVDGTGAPRFEGDIGIRDGLVAEIGALQERSAANVIDASGLIVAPGAIDLHTHYDAQIHWDPYCTSSGWHGTTTVVFSNCGFGFAPCKPEDRERYMRMMENTEQLPYEAMKRGLSWEWSTFPEWMDYLRRLPKGVNAGAYLPLNALISYVVGPDEAKTRSCTEAERAQMRELLDEAMDAGACGFSLTWLGADGGSHVDADQTPMPTDVMDPNDAYNLCDVLRERGEGVIMVICDVAPNIRREIAEEMARRSGRPILHNITLPVDGFPEMHRDTMRWIDEMNAQGLNIWSQGMTFNLWQELRVFDYNVWDCIPVFRLLSREKTAEGKVALASDQAYRARMRDEYDLRDYAAQTGGALERYVLLAAPGAPHFAKFEGRMLQDIATELGAPLTDVFLDIVRDTRAEAQMRIDDAGGTNPEYSAEILRHPRVLPGISDGGAHMKTLCGGQWTTEMLIKLTRENDLLTLEQLHRKMSGQTAEAFGFTDRGTLTKGKAADIMIYDHANLNYEFGRYKVLHDLPDGDWRRVTPVEGIRYILVNGVTTFIDGVCTDAVPGKMLTNERAEAKQAIAA